MSNHGESHDSHHGELGHIVPMKTYITVLVSLLILTVLTVVVAKYDAFDFGVLNIAIAMFIASIKATIVALFFMHLKFEDKVTWIYAAFPILLLLLLMAGIFIDNPLRKVHTPVQVIDSLTGEVVERAPLMGASKPHANSHGSADHHSGGDDEHSDNHTAGH